MPKPHHAATVSTQNRCNCRFRAETTVTTDSRQNHCLCMYIIYHNANQISSLVFLPRAIHNKKQQTAQYKNSLQNSILQDSGIYHKKNFTSLNSKKCHKRIPHHRTRKNTIKEFRITDSETVIKEFRTSGLGKMP